MKPGEPLPRGLLVVGLGEALFDCFPGGDVLGGAPVNVAVHTDALLQSIGGRAVPATRVGRDPLGARFARELAERGVSTEHTQHDPGLPTGRVAVAINSAGHASYTFDSPSAWDAIDFDEPMRRLAARCDAVAFGTLAQRGPRSRDAIRSFLGAAKQAFRLFDLNLRQSYYSAEVVDTSLRLASAAKLNDDELHAVGALLGLDTLPAHDFDGAVHELVARYGLEWVALTRGAAGTTIYMNGAKVVGRPASYAVELGADSVGAGDACCAGLLCGKLLGWPLDRTLRVANVLGAFVASRPGATPALPPELLRLVE
ncbi:MAG: PfkB family carbohydrate kinase [Lacipirellulaceae bacterium]